MTDREDKIRERAYGIWEEEGYPHGRAEDHWRRAVREIEGVAAGQADLITEIVGAPSLQTVDPAPAKKPAPKRRKAATGAVAAPKRAPVKRTTKGTPKKG